MEEQTKQVHESVQADSPMGDIFASIGMNAETGVEDKAETNQEPEEQLEAEGTEQAETPAEDQTEEVDSELEREIKRRKDTQKWANSLKQQMQAGLSKLVEEGAITVEQAEAMMAEAGVDAAPEGDNPFVSIGNQIQAELAVLTPVLEKRGENPKAAFDAFANLAVFDKSLQEELLDLPANERTAFVLQKGSELSDTFEIVQKQGGILGAINHYKKASDKNLDKIREEIRAEVEAEYEERMKEMTGAAKKPKLRGASSGDEKASEPTELTAIGLLGR